MLRHPVTSEKLHRQVTAATAKYGPQWGRDTRLIALELEYNVAIEMAESAQILGRSYEDLLRNADTLHCEWEFRSLSQRFVRKDLFYHDAFLFELFSPVHRRYLMYLIGRMMQVFYSRNRRKMAYLRVVGRNVQEVLDQRAWGIYRVEQDVQVKPTRNRKDKSKDK